MLSKGTMGFYHQQMSNESRTLILAYLDATTTLAFDIAIKPYTRFHRSFHDIAASA